MGIDIAIVDENGVKIEIIYDPASMTIRLLPDYSKADSPCLRFIDPYGDTVFNYLQIPVLINELEETLPQISDKVIVAHGRKIVELARRVMQGRHQYVKFIGD